MAGVAVALAVAVRVAGAAVAVGAPGDRDAPAGGKDGAGQGERIAGIPRPSAGRGQEPEPGEDQGQAGRRAGMFVILNTNGSRITEESAGELLEAGLGAVILSLHSATSPLHDRIKRRPGSFDEVLRSVRAFAAARRARALLGTAASITQAHVGL